MDVKDVAGEGSGNKEHVIGHWKKDNPFIKGQ